MIVAYRSRIAALVRDAKAAGELAPDCDAALTPILFIGAIQGLVIDASLMGDDARMNRRARRALRMLLDGLRAR